MVKRQQRVKPITLRRDAPVPSTTAAAGTANGVVNPARSKGSTQKVISTYHMLNKRLSAATKSGNSQAAAEVKAEIEALGGLHAYQRASLRGGNEKKGLGACGAWLVPHLRLKHKEEGSIVADAVPPDAEVVELAPRPKLKLLDVGALDGGTYAKQASWIEVTSIDLNPQSQSVRKQDFFERPLPRGDDERFDVLCLSLVVNFVGDPKLRGDMLIHARQFLFPRGLLYLVLPLPCVQNSRYMTHAHLVDILTSIGFELVEHHFARKLAFYLLRRVEKGSFKSMDWSKAQMNPGIDRNNFCIVVKRH